MSEANTPLERYLAGEITSGKFAELIGTKRHLGDEIISVAWKLQEQMKALQVELTTLRQDNLALVAEIERLKNEISNR